MPSSMYSPFQSNLIQYSLSLASFKAICIFEIKSFLLCANLLSATLAPIDVELFSNYFDITNSFLSINNL